MKSSAALVDVAFFLAIAGLILHPFVSDAIGKSESKTQTEVELRNEMLKSAETADNESAVSAFPTLTVDGSGAAIASLYLNDRALSLNDLTSEIKRQQIRSLRLRCNPGLDVGTLMEIKQRCHDGGVAAFLETRFLNHNP